MSAEIDLNEPVKYTLAGKKYEVPLGYHYVDFLKRKNRWPNPKDESTEVGAISITGLIPGVNPYEESTRAEFERLGHGNKIDILISPKASVYPMDEYLGRMKSTNRLRLLSSDLEGLTHFLDNQGGSDERKGSDVYIKEGESEYFMLQCPRMDASSPSCSVTKISDDGLQIEYTFAMYHLMSWREIDRDVDKRIEEFRVK
ncbi:hypothetical protein FZ025_19745 [Xanthomonas hyacinthi]|uniref:hypothetical protein n=1 Tax=Xanthomonas hyacinthi TaxID=56455 RepID=UPI00062D2962|nr:hypothetical protein [Xanthomonas hyacinthi]KLD73118.1 hypothetical protein Y886_39740 [Xanthomonas hyacinthi DSM 19077]QGY78764.1 hypothetical protein FZ025_19745 [Xanthomonas hyacinthi]